LSYEVNKKTIPISYSNRKRAILFVGRLDLHQKRIKFLIDLSKHLDFDIHVFGDGDLIETVKQNPNRIKYMGVFNKQNASEIYKEYLFTILVSKFEGFSFALVESLCNGTPIITTDSFDSAQFLVNNGANGLLLNHKDGVFKMAKTINNYIKQIAVNDYYHTLTNNAAEFSRSKLDDKIFTAN
jgi:poly(glycerol-phosphate) alpha-glucosyltransferase